MSKAIAGASKSGAGDFRRQDAIYPKLLVLAPSPLPQSFMAMTPRPAECVALISFIASTAFAALLFSLSSDSISLSSSAS
jgi:hypothetical protein